MADPVASPPEVPAVPAGKNTTEWFLTKIMIGVSGACVVLGGLTDTIGVVQGFVPAGSGIGALIVKVGAIIGVVSPMLYKAGRFLLKYQAGKTAAAMTIDQAAAELGKTVGG